ncbi:MAG: DUF1385 domain-containing protein [Syntrophomonadaceae bacterium]|nr:DUF1385 domain-containing protein [Syntrophomonadaceae bacterium]
MSNKAKKYNYGGMAVIEGVMMRGPDETAVAVRKPDGSIVIEKEANKKPEEKYPFLKWPFIRGTVALVSSMAVGIRMLNKSANLSMDDDEEELTSGEILATGLLALVLALALFVVLPTAIVHFAQQWLGGIFLQNLVEGAVRIVFLILYIVAITRMDDIKRVFMYHGAEHKTIFAHEKGLELTVENARLQSCSHPRCGTSFLLIVMVIAILVFALLGDGTLFYRVWSRLAVFPIVAGIGYELIKLSAKYYDRPLGRALIAPGLALQKLTTREPDDSQLEVAIRALNEVLKTDQTPAVEPVSLQV